LRGKNINFKSKERGETDMSKRGERGQTQRIVNMLLDDSKKYGRDRYEN